VTGPITHLRSIAITATEPSSLLPFYEDIWGLQQVSTDDDGTIHLRARSGEQRVLSLVPGDGHSLAAISLATACAAHVDEVAQRAASAGIGIEHAPAPLDGPGGGYGVVLRDPENRRIEVSSDVTAHLSEPSRDFGPDRISHIVLNCTDVAASLDFFVRVLGFRVSDRYENDQMVFLTCNQIHHCVVLAPGQWASLNHVAFEVHSADEVMRALGRMRKAGVDTVWGPGRHGPGGNVFAYFVDPAGNVIEYTAELLVIDDQWEPHEWPRTQENADVWGTSGGITPAVIQAMANPPAGLRS